MSFDLFLLVSSGVLILALVLVNLARKFFCHYRDLYFSKKELTLLKLLEDRKSVEFIFSCCNKLPENYLSNLEDRLTKYLTYFLEGCCKSSMNFWIINIKKMKETPRNVLVAATKRAIWTASLDKLASYYLDYLLDGVSETNPAYLYKKSDSYISDQFIFEVISSQESGRATKWNFAIKLREKAREHMQKSELAKGNEVLIEAELVRIERFFNHLDQELP